MLKRQGKGAERGNFVDAAWAAQGLEACASIGYRFPADLDERAAAGWREGKPGASEQIAALATHLFRQGKDWKKDADVRISLHRLREAELPTDPRSWAALKVALQYYGTETLGDRPWRPAGVKQLLASQAADGGWGGIEETCAAIEFLVVPRIRTLPIDDGRRRLQK